MEVLQVERVVPHLIDRRAIEQRIANFELQYEYDRTDQQHHINAATHSRDAKFEKDAAGQADEVGLQQPNLLKPRLSLRREHGEAAVSDQTPDDVIGVHNYEFGNRRVIPCS